MSVSTLSFGDISINIDDSFEEFEDNILKVLNMIIDKEDVTIESVNNLKSLLLIILKKVGVHGLSDDKKELLMNSHEKGRNYLVSLVSDSINDVQIEAFKSLIDLLPAQATIGKKPRFPDSHFGVILKTIVICERDITVYLNILKEILTYEDISHNIWKALEIACCKLIDSLFPYNVNNVLQIVNCTDKPKAKESREMGPLPYFCLVSDGVASDKDIGTSIKRLWDRLISVDLPPKLMQNLLLTLYERLIPRMNKPIFLIDFFMTSLEAGGAISLLALQGIFTLIQKYHMNYPDVYEKLYSMLNLEMLATPYKARFYYLTDIFLSSSHLPEALVAGFIKRFARLSLFAPPVDVIIMMAFIMNLLIRHPGLKKLIHNPESTDYESDPYLMDEKDPAKSEAMKSSLWEVKLQQCHVIPEVATSAAFINNPLPTVERDLSDLLEVTSDELFVKEYKKKMKNPPVSFEKPTTLHVPNTRSALRLWNFNTEKLE